MALQIIAGAGSAANSESGAPVKRVLIVDDEENVRNALRRSLRKEGYQLFFASGPAEGLKILAEQPIDLVMSDHMMPEMTGLEFLTIVRDRFPDVMRLMLTGHADMGTAIKAINHGEIYRFLTKPWDDIELKITLHLAFERQNLERENRRLMSLVRRQEVLIANLESEFPGIGQVARDSEGAIVLSSAEMAQVEQVH